MRLLGALLGATFLAGCAPRDAGFGDVRRSVRERAGADVRWDTDGEDDGTTSAEVRRLLAQPLTADAAVRVALLNNRELRADFEDLGVARAGLVAAGLLPNPRLHGDLRVPLGNSPGLDFDVEADLDLMSVLLLPARRGAASAEFEAAKLRATGRTLDLALRARTAFYRYQAARQTAALERTVLATAAAGFETTRQLHAAGNVPDLDLALGQTLYEESRLALAAVENAAVQERERLNALLGLWGADTGWQADERLATAPAREPDLVDLERRALTRSLDLAALQWRVTAAERRLDVAHARGVVPFLGAGVTVVREQGELSVGPSVTLAVPLFDQNQGESAARRAELRRLRATYMGEAVRVRAAVRAARAQLDYARQQAVFYRDVLAPLRQRVVAQTLLQYNAMQVPPFQLFEARRAQVAGARAAVAALRDYWLARATLTQLLAGASPAPTAPDMDAAGAAMPRAETGGH